jgi:hypothetical protein
MELLTILLSSLMAAISPTGLVVDRVIERNLRDRLYSVEQLVVRVDNSPSDRIIRGKVEKVRIASRGAHITENIRIDTLELETDPINLDLQRLRQIKEIKDLQQSLRQPFQSALHLALTEADLNGALTSKEVREPLTKLLNRFVSRRGGSQAPRYELLNPAIEFLANDRLRFQGQLSRVGSSDREAKSLEIILETGIKVINGRSMELIEPAGSINGRKLASQILYDLANGLVAGLDLRDLEKSGITARLLQLDIDSDRINLVTFVRIEPVNSSLDRQQQCY